MARSNRQLTQFAIDQIRGHLSAGPVAGVSKAGNTEVEVDVCNCGRPPHIIVRLFGKEILRIFMSPLNSRVVAGIMLRTGDFYDSKGRPSRTTRERLNGLLDFLCTGGFFPEGLRVFLRDDTGCYVGRGEACKAFDANNTAACLMTHPRDLVFA
tara:strand:+ start:1641 stop:2102 length:462 start_codon:yes stop_codon:yes gene_type:complete